MKVSTFFALFMTVASCLCFSQQVRAQNVYGYSSIDYNEADHRVTAYSTTELDYSVQEYYRARVQSKLTDENGTVLGSAYADDNFQSGYVTVVIQRLNTTAEEFEVKGTHYGILTLYDYNAGQRYYWDQFNYLQFLGIDIDYYGFYSFFGEGPAQRTNRSILDVGKTTSYAHTAPVRASLTLKNTGTIVPAPENEDYENEKGTAGGTDQLGPLPMGQGRFTLPGLVYTSPLMVIGQITPNSAYSSTFRWVRLLRRRSWYIEKNAVGTQWFATQRSRLPAQPAAFDYVDDTDPNGTFNDSTPSNTGKIYIYDNSAIAPSNAHGQNLRVGDFIREEKAFINYVEYFNGSKWVRIGRLPVGQITIIKRIATTGVVADDWQGIENSTAARTTDAIITSSEVRKMVGGDLPIVIDVNTNN